MKQGEPKPHSFCETPEEKCTMNYCDTNGCQNRKRELVELQEQFKQETLEEAGLNHCDMLDKFPALVNPLFSFKEGAKWQQEQDKNKYNEVIEMLWLKYRAYTNNEDAWSFKEWLVEQFKKK